MSLSYRAMKFAFDKHKDQKRKYTNLPYTTHLAEVAGLVSTFTDSRSMVKEDVVLAAAWLHDVVEDCPVPLEMIQSEFGCVVSKAVQLLTAPAIEDRSEKKSAVRTMLSKAPGWVQNIKCADLYSNMSSIRVWASPEYSRMYLTEGILLLSVMNDADSRLWRMVGEMIRDELKQSEEGL